MWYNIIVGGARSPGDRKEKHMKTMNKHTHRMQRFNSAVNSAKIALKEGREHGFIYQMGRAAAELNAISADELAAIGEDFINEYIDLEDRLDEMLEIDL